jgi:hypothetical protein
MVNISRTPKRDESGGLGGPLGAIGSVAGGILGAIFGETPQSTAAGASAGSALGSGIGNAIAPPKVTMETPENIGMAGEGGQSGSMARRLMSEPSALPPMQAPQMPGQQMPGQSQELDPFQRRLLAQGVI